MKNDYLLSPQAPPARESTFHTGTGLSPTRAGAADAMEYLRRYQQGDHQAAEELLRRHGGLVRRIARTLLPYAGCLELDDLVIEGQLGLLAAAKSFDAGRGYAFSTLVGTSIHRRIVRAIAEQGRMIRLPAWICEREAQFHRTRELLVQRLGREPEPEELAAETGLPVPTMRIFAAVGAAPVSLDGPVDADEETRTTLGELLAGPEELEEEVVTALTAAWALSALPPQERQAVELRFGFCSPEPLSWAAVAIVQGVSAECARLRVRRALRRLRELAGVESG